MSKRYGKKRSKFEVEIGDWLEPHGFDYEPHSIDYVTYQKYTPDFYIEVNGYEILVECKGWFRPGDRQKYKAVRDSLSDTQELLFILYAPDKKVQKGAKLTMAEWCDKEQLFWYCRDSMDNLIRHVERTRNEER